MPVVMLVGKLISSRSRLLPPPPSRDLMTADSMITMLPKASLHPCQHCIFFIIHLDRQVLVCLQEAKEQDEGVVGETIREFFIIFPLQVNMG